jgi:Mrp family chromosome partitioning ATPase
MLTKIASDPKVNKQVKQMGVQGAPINKYVQVEKQRRKIQVSFNNIIKHVLLVVAEVAEKLKGIKNVIIVLSGKGGVGKSTVST